MLMFNAVCHINPRRLLAGGFVLFLSVGLFGCGGGTGTVTGKVQVNGKVVPSGLVTIIASDNGSYRSPVKKDGTYEISGVPVGLAKITVTNAPEIADAGPPTADGTAPKAPPGSQGAAPVKIPTIIPKKYETAAESGLTYTVKSGSQTYDLDLK